MYTEQNSFRTSNVQRGTECLPNKEFFLLCIVIPKLSLQITENLKRSQHLNFQSTEEFAWQFWESDSYEYDSITWKWQKLVADLHLTEVYSDTMDPDL